MGRRRDLRNLFEQLDVLAALAEFVIADQRAERRSAEHPEFFLVYLLE